MSKFGKNKGMYTEYKYYQFCFFNSKGHIRTANLAAILNYFENGSTYHSKRFLEDSTIFKKIIYSYLNSWISLLYHRFHPQEQATFNRLNRRQAWKIIRQPVHRGRVPRGGRAIGVAIPVESEELKNFEWSWFNYVYKPWPYSQQYMSDSYLKELEPMFRDLYAYLDRFDTFGLSTLRHVVEFIDKWQKMGRLEDI